ncbi:ABC transporter ATP-binding protein/permease [Limibaculum sp. FT325]|uniref:ATP-binding cassette domain-containing protein n=1 Tax=Thermohalobaculum sediminis TaxID=2939436 RepID=UPI0020C0037B|nr:ABC transporter ATP-binding protein [Limibaculum sediminis]MCL5776776.1 ABC transporter ATP-binding protein/permease [Limibaculum sediminis]
MSEPAEPRAADGAAGRQAQLALFRLFRAHAGAGLWRTAALVLGAALLEGAGVLLLVPLISLVLGGPDAAGRAGQVASQAFEALGVTRRDGQLALGLGAFLGVVALRAAVDLARARSMLGLAMGFVVALRRHFFTALAAAPWHAVAGLDREAAGHSLSIDLGRAEGFVWGFWSGLLAAVSLAVYGAIAMVVAPVMTLVAAAIGAALFLALRPLRRRAGRLGAELSATDAGLYGQTGRFLAGLKPARAHRLSEAYGARSVAAAERVAERSAAIRMDLALGSIAMQTAVAVAAALVVLAGVVATDAGPEALIAMLLILVRIVGPFQTLQHALQGMASAAAAYAAAEGRLEAALAGARAEPVVDPRPVTRPPALALEGVSFTAGGSVLLSGIVCHVPAGRVTLVAGDSGSGKTTLCDLLSGLARPERGVLTVDGAPADAALRAGLAEVLAYVGQEPFLIEPTLRANLAWGARGQADEAAMRAALNAVGAGGLLAGLPEGLDTQVGPDATRFSGGERQRLRLARAILRRPQLVMLDEATNALDAAAEAEVLAGLRHELCEATVVLVSHRPAALALADHVIWLEAGRVAEEGEAAALLADPSSRTARWWRPTTA